MTVDNIHQLLKFNSDKEFVRKYIFALNELGLDKPALIDRVLLKIGAKVPPSLYRKGMLDIIILGIFIFIFVLPVNLIDVLEYRSSFTDELINSIAMSALFALLFAILLSFTSHRRKLTSWENI